MNPLNSSDFTVAGDPFALLKRWLAEASERELNDPEAMTLASVDALGLPDARMMLCKQADERGFVFYTNAESAKGRRIRGDAEGGGAVPLEIAAPPGAPARRGGEDSRSARRTPISPAGRALSRIGAWASQQSRPLESRAKLEQAVAFYARRNSAIGEIPRPPYWRRLPADADRDRILAGRRSSACTIASCSRARARASPGARAALSLRRAGARQLC